MKRTLAALLLIVLAATLHAEELPRLERKGTQYTMVVDGQPFFVLGAQVGNSSGAPEKLATLWPQAEQMHLNTLEVPIYWEQLEPAEGKFDDTAIDAVVRQARDHHMRLVLLWFGSWKNGKSHYIPEWVKTDQARFPRMTTRTGQPIDVLSPNSLANRDADTAAFVHLMHRLKQIDGTAHTVIMVQVENESGSLGSVRDFSPAAQKTFNSPIPTALRHGSGTWTEAFGKDADETFAAWSIATYIHHIAEAGKRELALPMYVNNWLKSPRGFPVQTIPGDDYPSGGPTSNMLDLWKLAAPSIDILAPDIYVPNTGSYVSVMRAFHRADNPLFIPETHGFGGFPNADAYARNLFLALGEGAIGFSPFGLDNFSLTKDGEPDYEAQGMAENNRLLAPITPLLARLQFEGKLRTAVEEPGLSQRELEFGGWNAIVSFPPSYDPPARTLTPSQRLRMGRLLLSPIGPNEFLAAGIDSRLTFRVPPGSGTRATELLHVEEGRYEGDRWIPIRTWNGDETDYGINFSGHGAVLHIKLGMY